MKLRPEPASARPRARPNGWRAARTLPTAMEERRLDLVALRLGYDSEEATLRAAVRAQFPKITLGLTRASDNSALKSLGPNAVFDLPFFDRNQGNVAMEKATRQQLFDDYVGRVYDARNDIAKAAADLRFTARREEAARAAIPALERLAGSYADRARRGRGGRAGGLGRAAVARREAAGGGKTARRTGGARRRPGTGERPAFADRAGRSVQPCIRDGSEIDPASDLAHV